MNLFTLVFLLSHDHWRFIHVDEEGLEQTRKQQQEQKQQQQETDPIKRKKF